MDYYQTLGIAKNANPDEIKKAYRKLASTHHPDKGGDTAKFQQIQAAYETLSDPQKRQQYDNPPPQGGGFPFGGMGGGGGFDMNDLFGQIFRQQHNTHQRQKQVFRTPVTVSLEDAYTGCSHILNIQTPTGVKTINLSVPKGLNHGDQMRYDTILDEATLIVEFRITPSLIFDRRGNDLICNHQISVLDLIVGTTFEFTTISGKILEVTVQPITQPFMQLKLAGEGMPIQGSTLYGDQIILLKPFIPAIINDDITQSILRSQQK